MFEKTIFNEEKLVSKDDLKTLKEFVIIRESTENQNLDPKDFILYLEKASVYILKMEEINRILRERKIRETIEKLYYSALLTARRAFSVVSVENIENDQDLPKLLEIHLVKTSRIHEKFLINKLNVIINQFEKFKHEKSVESIDLSKFHESIREFVDGLNDFIESEVFKKKYTAILQGHKMYHFIALESGVFLVNVEDNNVIVLDYEFNFRGETSMKNLNKLLEIEKPKVLSINADKIRKLEKLIPERNLEILLG